MAVETTVTVTASSIFLDKRVLQTHHMPERIVGRERQLAAIRSTLKDLERDVRPRNPFCVGDFGTGKTVVARFACRTLPAGVVGVYANCSDDDTCSRVFKAILRSLEVPFKPGLPRDHYLNLIREALKKVKFLVLILDEVDRLVSRKPQYGGDSDANMLFYALSRTIENVVVLMLTNRLSFEASFAANVDSAVRDTFRYMRIDFDDYSVAELTEILGDRCKAAFREGTYEEAVNLIAALSFRRGLRARGVIDLALKAGEIAEAQGHFTITEDDVRAALNAMTATQEMSVIRRLPPVQHAILAYILTYSPTWEQLIEWWTKYAEENQYGPSPATLRGYVKDLETMGLVVKDKHGLGRGKGVTMTLRVPPEFTASVTKSLLPDPEKP
jgi:cell division control protein 6